MKSRIRISLFVMFFCFFCASFFVVRSVLTQNQTKVSMRERAKRDGKVVTKFFPRLNRYDTLEALKKDSAAIVLGTITGRATRVSPHTEDAVSTDYTIIVQETFKGDFVKDNLVRINEVGGKLVYEDGTYAEVVLPEFWNTPQLEKTYVLFLSPKDGGDYRLVGGPQGMFEVEKSGLLKPQGLPTDDLFLSHQGMTVKKFAERIRTNVEERAAAKAIR